MKKFTLIAIISFFIHHKKKSSPTVFSAGLDILEMYKPELENGRHFWTQVQEVWLKLYGSSFPTAAAINVSIITKMPKFQFDLICVQKFQICIGSCSGWWLSASTEL